MKKFVNFHFIQKNGKKERKNVTSFLVSGVPITHAASLKRKSTLNCCFVPDIKDKPVAPEIKNWLRTFEYYGKCHKQ